MQINVLCASTCFHHIHAWLPLKGEEGVKSSEVKVKNSHGPHYGCEEANPGPPQ